MRNEVFGGHLKAAFSSIANNERKPQPLIEEELGALIGQSVDSIRRYKSGHIPPDTKAVEIFAEAAVTRGFFNREWVQRFLHSSRYPNPNQILERLFPQQEERQKLPKIYQNLPSPPYSRFVMREGPYHETISGLTQRSAVVYVASLGGMGKTSLVREIAQRCFEENSEVPTFDAIVWISDKGHEGTTSLNTVLDTISQTLDYGGFLRLLFEDKKREIDNILRRQSVLIVVDNFETITDQSLVTWLVNLPEPSKAIVTSREYSRFFRNNTYVVDLKGMEDFEAKEFIENRFQMLGLADPKTQWSQIEPLVRATGGNPKALELSIGYIKYEHRPLPAIIEELYQARGGIFEDLFARGWNLLSNDGKNILMSMALFPFSASPKALMHVSGVQGYQFDQNMTQLTDLALIDVRQKDISSTPSYFLHMLVHSFAKSKLQSSPGFEMEATDKWLGFYRDLASQIGFAWNEIKRLKSLDREGERETIEAVVEWAAENNKYDDVIQITKDIRYFYYVRGFWSTRNNLLRAEIARKLNRPEDEFEALTYHVNIASKQENVKEVEKYLPRLEELQNAQKLDAAATVDFRHAKALYLLAKNQFDDALALWKQNTAVAGLHPHAANANNRWMAICMYEKGKAQNDVSLIGESIRLLKIARDDAVVNNFERGEISANIYIIGIELASELTQQIFERLDASIKQAIEAGDQRAEAELYLLLGNYHKKSKSLPEAIQSLEKAIDKFERLGLLEKLLDARQEMAALLEEFAAKGGPFLKDFTLDNDNVQKQIKGHLLDTERLLSMAAKSITGGDTSAEIWLMPDLGLPRNVLRMMGGFYTGALYRWESSEPMIPVDATVNVCGVSVFSVNRDIESPEEFQRLVSAAQRTTIEQSSFIWNFQSGNHFIIYGRVKGFGSIKSGNYLVLHSSAAEYKKQWHGLYPVKGNWFYDEIKTIELPNKNRYLRFINGKMAERFYRTVKMLEEYNALRHAYFAGLIIGENNLKEEIINIQHYGMPNEQSIAIGCQWLRSDDVYLLLTSPNKPMYFVSVKESPENRVEFNHQEYFLSPHGFGVGSGEEIEIDYLQKGLKIDKVGYTDEETLQFDEMINIRHLAGKNETEIDLASKILQKCPGVIIGEIKPIYSYMRNNQTRTEGA